MKQAQYFPNPLLTTRHVFAKKVHPRRGSEFVRIMSLISPAEHKERLAGFLVNETDQTIEQLPVLAPTM